MFSGVGAADWDDVSGGVLSDEDPMVIPGVVGSGEDGLFSVLSADDASVTTGVFSFVVDAPESKNKL